MSTPTRQRLIQAALELFIAQGVTNTTTRQIANLADVNEVTLFRQFGNKYGLLLAVIESPHFANLGEALILQAPAGQGEQALKNYATSYLHSLSKISELLRSLIGEADQYSAEIRVALGQRLTEINRSVAGYLASAMPQSRLDPEKFASLLNALLLGHAAVELISDQHQLWRDQAEFLAGVGQLFLQTAANADETPATEVEQPATDALDLPAAWVHRILQQAKKSGLQDYALAYVLFGSGISPAEAVRLRQTDQISNPQQHLLQVRDSQGVRQVPLNQWILGKRYGSYTNNPLTQWLKQRKDENTALFIGEVGQPLSVTSIQQRWQKWTDSLSEAPLIAQAQHTWRVEMLMRGMSLDNLSVLTGEDKAKLQTYAQRAKEKTALEQAVLLDRRRTN